MTGFSFEFFPPKTEVAEQALWQVITDLSDLRPEFVSVTYGAGGSTRARTHASVKRLVNETPLEPAAHLTCVGASREEIDQIIDEYASAGVRHVVALRGDMPDMGAYSPHPKGYLKTADLVARLCARGFEVSVSAYPETHPESVSFDHDLNLLREKWEAGATQAITQFAFDTQAYQRLRDAAVAAGIMIDILPGIMPTTNFKGARQMAEKCGAHVPADLIARFEGLEDDLAARREVAIEFAIAQCEQLRANGFARLHFYTLNQSAFTRAVCSELTRDAV